MRTFPVIMVLAVCLALAVHAAVAAQQIANDPARAGEVSAASVGIATGNVNLAKPGSVGQAGEKAGAHSITQRIVAMNLLGTGPQKVQVRYGTIIRDPVDGHVWEDQTKTAWVDPSQANDYRVEYVDKLSPEHEQAAAQQAAQSQQQASGQTSSGLTSLQAPIDEQTMQDLETLQSNIETAGNSLISGMEMASR